MTIEATPRPLFNPPIVRRAALDALRTIDLRVQIRNPVMFIVFLLACATLLPFSLYCAASAGGQPISLTVLVALLICLIPTTIGGLLSTIGIAGMDRMIQATSLRYRAGRSSWGWARLRRAQPHSLFTNDLGLL